MKANQIKVGQKVTTSGFTGAVIKVCEWSRNGDEVMVEIRLASGVTCVSCKDVVLE